MRFRSDGSGLTTEVNSRVDWDIQSETWCFLAKNFIGQFIPQESSGCYSGFILQRAESKSVESIFTLSSEAIRAHMELWRADHWRILETLEGSEHCPEPPQ